MVHLAFKRTLLPPAPGTLLPPPGAELGPPSQRKPGDTPPVGAGAGPAAGLRPGTRCKTINQAARTLIEQEGAESARDSSDYSSGEGSARTEGGSSPKGTRTEGGASPKGARRLVRRSYDRSAQPQGARKPGPTANPAQQTNAPSSTPLVEAELALRRARQDLAAHMDAMSRRGVTNPPVEPLPSPACNSHAEAGAAQAATRNAAANMARVRRAKEATPPALISAPGHAPTAAAGPPAILIDGDRPVGLSEEEMQIILSLKRAAAGGGGGGGGGAG